MDTQKESVDVAAKAFGKLQAIMLEFPEVKTCSHELVPTDAESLPNITLQTIAGDPVEKNYLDGGRVEKYRFALHLRQQVQGSQEGLNARLLLERIASQMEHADIDLGSDCASWGASIDSLPVRAEGSEGFVDWQTELTLKYRTNR